MKRSFGLASAFFLLLILPATALAAPGKNVHGTDSSDSVDPDFCGTGTSIDVSFEVTFTAHEGKAGTFKATEHGSFTFTNPATGDAVIVRFAQQYTETLLSGDPDGVHTIAFTYKGLPEQIWTPHGRPLSRDAGFLTVVEVYDGDELLSSTITVKKGPHPEADSDFALFCEVTTEALGIV